MQELLTLIVKIESLQNKSKFNLRYKNHKFSHSVSHRKTFFHHEADKSTFLLETLARAT